MKTFLIILGVIVIGALILKKFLPKQHHLIIVFGSPGSGKTTVLARAMAKSRYHRYANFDTFDLQAKKIDPLKLGEKFRLQPWSILCIDEAGIDYNNRKSMSIKTGMSQDQIGFYKYHRHDHLDIWVTSQRFDDIDISIRALCDRLYYVQSFGPFTILRRVNKKSCVDPQTQQIIDGYKFVPVLLGGLTIFYRKPYYKYFDSFVARKELPYYEESEEYKASQALDSGPVDLFT